MESFSVLFDFFFAASYNHVYYFGVKMERILIIDDDIVIRSIIREALEEKGYTVSEAENGKIGLRLHDMQPYPLIITDIIMPDMEGLETINKIRKKDQDTKIIAISGGGMQDAQGYLDIAEKMGADEIISKPFEKQDIIEKVSFLLSD